MYKKIQNKAIGLKLLSYFRKFSISIIGTSGTVTTVGFCLYMFSKAKCSGAIVFRLPAFLEESEMVTFSSQDFTNFWKRFWLGTLKT